jgi:hypothetical protein
MADSVVAFEKNAVRDALASEIACWRAIGAPAGAMLLKEFVLEFGQPFPFAKRDRLGKPKMCFKNAFGQMFRAGFEYVEGFAMSRTYEGFTFHHAWTFDKSDPTRALEATLRDPANYQFFGVVLPSDMVLEEVVKQKVYGVLDTGRGPNIDFMNAYRRRRAGLG